MRKLMWFTLGFTAALVLGTLGREILLVPVAGVMALVFEILTRKNRIFGIFISIFLGTFLGSLWLLGFQTRYLAPVSGLDGKMETVTLRASDYGVPTERGTSVDTVLELRGKPCRVRACLNEKADVAPGDLLEGKFRFRLTVPGGKEAATRHGGQGIFLLAFQKEHTEIREGEQRWYDRPAILRKNLKDTLDRYFPKDAAPFARALLLGDGSGLSYETDLDLRISGIRHLAAVSGFHVAILFGLVRNLTLRRRWLTLILGSAALAGFAAVVGFTPSVTRAAVMITLMMLAQAVGRDYDPLTELSFACLVMMVVNPLVITSVSFQLSAASVLGILLFGERVRQWLEDRFPVDRKKKRWKRTLAGIWTGLSVSLSALIFVTPLCARYFGAVSLVSVLTNFLTLWIVRYVFYGIVAVCILGSFWTRGAEVIAGLTSWGIRYVLGTAGLCARLPLAAVYTKSPYVVFWLIFLYLLLGIFLVQRKKQPGLLVCCGVLGLCLALGCSWLEPFLGNARMTVFDVGQGQCILLQSHGKSFLVDCGGDRDEEAGTLAAETLLSQGIRHLDGILLTHFDRDHVGGVPYLLPRVSTERLLTPVGEMDGATQITEITELTFEGGKITVYPGIAGGSPNENCLCVLFESENCDILITGDRSEFGERLLLRQADLPQVDVLMAGHHGAKDSTCPELLEAVEPGLVIISAGRDNPYGHPAPETLERLKPYPVLRTDRDGTVIIRR